MTGAVVEPLPYLDDVFAEMQARLARDLARIGWQPGTGRRHRWGDPIEVGDRVRLTLGHITQLLSPIGYVVAKDSPVYGGVAATTAGTVLTIGEPFDFLATVEWDDGYVQTLAVNHLIHTDLLQAEAILWHAGHRA